MAAPQFIPDGQTVNVKKVPSLSKLAEFTLGTYHDILKIDLTQYPTAKALVFENTVNIVHLEQK